MINNQPQPPERKRVWFFGKSENIPELDMTCEEQKIYEKGDNRYVIVRINIVEEFDFLGQTCNLVIPVDAAVDGLEEAKSELKKLGIQIFDKHVSVVWHTPWPPHKAHGFITDKEAKALPIEQLPIQAGRQHASPGSNKWG